MLNILEVPKKRIRFNELRKQRYPTIRGLGDLSLQNGRLGIHESNQILIELHLPVIQQIHFCKISLPLEKLWQPHETPDRNFAKRKVFGGIVSRPTKMVF